MLIEDINKRLAYLMNGSDKSIDAVIANYEKQIEKNYRKALEEIKKYIASMYERYGDEVKYSDMASYNRLTNLEQQIADKIRSLTGENIKTTKSGIKNIFSETYYQTGYSLETAVAINAGFGLLNDKVIDASVLNEFDTIGWNKRMEANANIYNRQLKETLTQGLLQGHGYAKMAKSFSDKTNIDFGRSIRIMRTEGGRAQSAAKVIGFDRFELAAERQGFKTARVWLSTLDMKTRNSHRSMDGQKADENGDFHFPFGGDTKGPRLSGIAEQDINCRCTLISEIEGIPQKYRRDNMTKEILPNKSYDDWAIDKGIKLRNGIKTDDIGFNQFKKYSDKQLKDNFEKFNFTSDEAGAIKYYTSDEGKILSLNKALRAGTVTKNQKTIQRVLDNALGKLPNYEGNVYRGINVNTDMDSFLKDYTKGKSINFKQFMSSTSKKSETYTGNIQYNIKSKTGKDLSSLSFKEKEKEILFRTNTMFTVKKLDNRAGKIYIELEEK